MACSCVVALYTALLARSTRPWITWISWRTARACACLDETEGSAVAEPATTPTAARIAARSGRSVRACRFLELIEKPLVRLSTGHLKRRRPSRGTRPYQPSRTIATDYRSKSPANATFPGHLCVNLWYGPALVARGAGRNRRLMRVATAGVLAAALVPITPGSG